MVETGAAKPQRARMDSAAASAPAPAGAEKAKELPPTIAVEEVYQACGLHEARMVRAPAKNSTSALCPDALQLHCEKCEGARTHYRTNWMAFDTPKQTRRHVCTAYKCINCQSTEHVFVLRMEPQGQYLCVLTKVYQEPPFGNPIPKRLFKIIGEDNREYFLRARRAIARGLGVGAFAYYRRIVESQKLDLVEAFLDVAVGVNAPPEQIEKLKVAAKERQFSKAVEIIGDAAEIPAQLLINGHNPLAILHDLLSEGVHALSDEECLGRAKSAEVILCEIAERLDRAVTDRKAVADALKEVLKRKRKA